MTIFVLKVGFLVAVDDQQEGWIEYRVPNWEQAIALVDRFEPTNLFVRDGGL